MEIQSLYQVVTSRARKRVAFERGSWPIEFHVDDIIHVYTRCKASVNAVHCHNDINVYHSRNANADFTLIDVIVCHLSHEQGNESATKHLFCRFAG